MDAYIFLAVVGLAAGFAGGLLGIGGSVILIPAMNELFGYHQHVHQGAAMIVNFFVVAPAAVQHARANAIAWPVVKGMAPAAVIAVIVGVFVSELPFFAGSGQAYLVLLFAGFIAYVAAVDLYRMTSRSVVESTSGFGPQNVSPWKAGLLVGVPTGITAGLLGVGGGIIMVPLQRRVLHVPLRIAIANSATTIIVLSLVGAATKNYALITEGLMTPWWTTFRLAGVLIPTAMIGATIGSKLVHVLPVKHIRFAFIGLMLVFAVRLFLRAWSMP